MTGLSLSCIGMVTVLSLVGVLAPGWVQHPGPPTVELHWAYVVDGMATQMAAVLYVKPEGTSIAVVRTGHPNLVLDAPGKVLGLVSIGGGVVAYGGGPGGVPFAMLVGVGVEGVPRVVHIETPEKPWAHAVFNRNERVVYALIGGEWIQRIPTASMSTGDRVLWEHSASGRMLVPGGQIPKILACPSDLAAGVKVAIDNGGGGRSVWLLCAWIGGGMSVLPVPSEK